MKRIQPNGTARARPIALALAAVLLSFRPAAADPAGSTWQVASSSRLSVLGTVRFFTAKNVATVPGTAPYTWKTVGTVTLPRIPLAFGQYIDFLQAAPAEGTVDWNGGVVTLALPLQLRDSASATQAFTANLTTGATNAYNSDGAPYCSGTSADPSWCRGTPLGISGAFRMVAIVNIPQTGETLGSGALFLLEIAGTMSQPCSGTVCTALDTCHLAGTCDPATGTCSNPVAPNGTSCSDGNACTRTDSCQGGTCLGSNPVTCSASGACRVAGTCDPSTGACSSPAAPNGTACSDGNACTRSDSCQAGACVGTNPVVCTASDACHAIGACDPATGACSNPAAPNGTACSDGNACTRSDACQSGACVGSNPVSCTAADACHAAGTCDPGSGACSNPVLPNGTACEDGNACTRPDLCSNGTCASGPVAVPEDVGSGVRMTQGSGITRIVWTPPAGAAAFDVARGLVSRLPVGAAEGESCIVDSATGTETSDSAAPPLGSGYWYLIRGDGACGQGPYGYEGVNGTPTTARATSVCSGPCRTAADCPGVDTQCATRTCVASLCGWSYAASGITACSANGGRVCDGAGACVACVVASDCASTDTACRTRSCGASAPNTCGFTNAPAGTSAAQTPGDCRKSVCDGAGGVTSVIDNTDVPVDGNPCTNDVCTSGAPGNPPVASGTPCTSSTLSGVCDGSGSCVPCGGTMQRCCPSYPICRPGLTCRSGLCR